MLKSILQLVLITFLILFLFNISHKPDLTSIKYVNIDNVHIKVDLALTARERMLGLSGKEGLDEGKGLLFVFENPGKYKFWMKDMKFPIDIIWISSDLKIVFIKSDVSPLYYPETYGPENDAQYVLEVMAGSSEKNNWKVGDAVLLGY